MSNWCDVGEVGVLTKGGSELFLVSDNIESYIPRSCTGMIHRATTCQPSQQARAQAQAKADIAKIALFCVIR